MTTLRIHPAIGVARLGNSEDFFIGPEESGIPANWDAVSRKFNPFKDASGLVKRQAARFRIFEFDAGGNALREITLADVAKIEWRVHVANRKGSFFTFNGQRGAETTPPYAVRAAEPANKIEKPDRGRGQPQRFNRRNVGITDRRNLEIDPGEQAISAPGELELIDNVTTAPIRSLGKIRMEDSGRLLFLGGRGQTASSANPPPQIDEYANNDTWFDDASDGVIKALVTLKDGTVVTPEPAWVIVGPPKFAPGIRNVVSLYDTLWDLAVRFGLDARAGNDQALADLVDQQKAWRAASSDFADNYTPSFTEHIYPILSRALAARDVHASPRADYHGTLSDWTRLSDPSGARLRAEVFKRIRNPTSADPDWLNMPRGLGDDFTSLDDFEGGRRDAPSARAFLSLTQVQYALLKAWQEGRFKSDWNSGDVRFAPIPVPGTITPHGLDRAALENCVGGPFFPGIEVSWLVRETSIYRAAFRFKDTGIGVGPLNFDAGFFSQQMAQPWTADFYDCHKEDHTPPNADEPVVYMWWTAQRPDDIRPDADSALRRWVEPFDAAKDKDLVDTDADDIENLARFEQMRTRWQELSFLVLEDDQYVEQK